MANWRNALDDALRELAKALAEPTTSNEAKALVDRILDAGHLDHSTLRVQWMLAGVESAKPPSIHGDSALHLYEAADRAAIEALNEVVLHKRGARAWRRHDAAVALKPVIVELVRRVDPGIGTRLAKLRLSNLAGGGPMARAQSAREIAALERLQRGDRVDAGLFDEADLLREALIGIGFTDGAAGATKLSRHLRGMRRKILTGSAPSDASLLRSLRRHCAQEASHEQLREALQGVVRSVAEQVPRLRSDVVMRQPEQRQFSLAKRVVWAVGAWHLARERGLALVDDSEDGEELRRLWRDAYRALIEDLGIGSGTARLLRYVTEDLTEVLDDRRPFGAVS